MPSIFPLSTFPSSKIVDRPLSDENSIFLVSGSNFPSAISFSPRWVMNWPVTLLSLSITSFKLNSPIPRGIRSLSIFPFQFPVMPLSTTSSLACSAAVCSAAVCSAAVLSLPDSSCFGAASCFSSGGSLDSGFSAA